MNIILSSFDALLCILVVGAEYLRKIHPFEQPVLAIAFYLVAIGAFGGLAKAIHGFTPSLYVVLMHAGVVLYAWARRDHVFDPVGAVQK